MQRKKTHIRKKEIIDSAKKIISEKSLTNLTIKNLALHNDLSEGAIYRHFDSKHDLYMELVLSFGDELSELVAQEKKLCVGEPLHCLQNIMKNIFQMSTAKKGIFFALTTESIHFQDESLRDNILAVIFNFRDEVVNILSEARQQGLIRPGLDLAGAAHIYFGLFQSVIALYSLSNYQMEPMSLFNTYWDIFIHGINHQHGA